MSVRPAVIFSDRRPLSVWQLNEEAGLGIFEAGISEMGRWGALKRMIKPTIGILTNIGGAHQENFFLIAGEMYGEADTL